MLYTFSPERLVLPVQILLPTVLRHLRRVNYMSQKDLAQALQIDRSTYAYYELGKTRPEFETLICLARAYGVSVDSLLLGTRIV